jgi:hypothetical protein
MSLTISYRTEAISGRNLEAVIKVKTLRLLGLTFWRAEEQVYVS